MERIIRVGGILMLSLFLSACGYRKPIPEKDVESMVKEEMERKYGISVDVHSIEFDPGSRAFQEGYYYVDVSHENQEFSVIVGKSSGDIEDDYARYLIGESIEEKVQAAFEGNASASITNYVYEIKYEYSKYQWINTEEIERYFDVTGSFVSITLYPDGEDPDTIAEDVYRVLKELEEEGIHFSTKFEYKGKTIYLSSNETVGPMKTLAEIEQKLREVE